MGTTQEESTKTTQKTLRPGMLIHIKKKHKYMSRNQEFCACSEEDVEEGSGDLEG
jgi:hypothetical protein